MFPCGACRAVQWRLTLASILKIAFVVGEVEKFVLLNPDGAIRALKTIFEI
jgi:hypothetical protein